MKPNPSLVGASPMKMLSSVAVPAQHLQTGGPSHSPQSGIEGFATLARRKGTTMLGPVVVYMIQDEEFLLRFTTALANAAVLFDSLKAVSSITFSLALSIDFNTGWAKRFTPVSRKRIKAMVAGLSFLSVFSKICPIFRSAFRTSPVLGIIDRPMACGTMLCIHGIIVP